MEVLGWLIEMSTEYNYVHKMRHWCVVFVFKDFVEIAKEISKSTISYNIVY